MWWHYLLSSTKVFGLAAREGSIETSSTTSQPTINIGLMLFQLYPIVIAVIFSAIVKDKIKQKENFNGIGWGVANGLGAGLIGLLCVVIVHSSLNKELDKMKDKKYVTYAKNELKRFIKSYAICSIIVLVVSILLFCIQLNQG